MWRAWAHSDQYKPCYKKSPYFEGKSPLVSEALHQQCQAAPPLSLVDLGYNYSPQLISWREPPTHEGHLALVHAGR